MIGGPIRPVYVRKWLAMMGGEAMAKQTEYAILVVPLADADGGGWLASVPALPGCTGDGETREAALADVQNAIAEWKDAARQLGRDVPNPAALAAD